MYKDVLYDILIYNINNQEERERESERVNIQYNIFINIFSI